MEREIRLDGGEITVLKALGLSGTAIRGKMLLQNMEMEEAELLETLNGLLLQGYILSNKVNVDKIVDVEHAFFRINPSYARDLRDAMRPGRRLKEERSRRRRG